MSFDRTNAAAKPWLFFGVGNVLFNEDPAFAHIYMMMYSTLQSRDESITFDRLLCERDELIKEGQIRPLKTLIEEYLTDEENATMRLDFRNLLEEDWLKYNPLNPGVKESIKQLSESYHIGLIANSPAFLRAVLQDVGIMKYFKVAIISEEVGMHKPSKSIFMEALETAKEYCERHQELFLADQCIMVGDSLEQDIAPSNELGITSVLMAWDLNIKYEGSPLLANETFVTYLNHLKSYSSRRREPDNEFEHPQHQVCSMKDLVRLLKSGKIKKTQPANTRS